MNFDNLLYQAQEQESKGHLQKAESYYHQMLSDDPKNVKALTRLGLLSIKKGEVRAAQTMLKWAASLAPEEREVKNALNQLQGDHNNFQSSKNRDSAQTCKSPSKALNILFLQNSPCIRNYKMATALRTKGHRVTLGYTQKRLSQRYSGLSDDTYDENIHITSYRQLWDISGNYDLIHSHNEPDELTVAALAGDCPVIHDTHDLISLRANNDPGLAYFEGIANRGAHGRIATTPFQQREVENMYGPNNPGLVFYNYASQADLPQKFHPKLSKRDGQVHFVYEGGLSEKTHRDFRDIFVEMAVRGLHVHIYPAAWSDKLAAFFSRHGRIHYNKPVSPKVLMEEMTRYDIGIIPWNLEKGNKRFLDSTIANKLFEYLAAGLPVATSRLQSYEDFFEHTPVGVTFDSVQELVDTHVHRLLEMAKTIDFTNHVYTFENEIQRVEVFYRSVLENGTCVQTIAADEAPGSLTSGKQGEHISSTFRTETETKQHSQATIQTAFDRFTNWLLHYGWDGYDPYDVEDFIMNLESQGQKISAEEKKAIRIAGKKDPMTIRKKFNIPKKRIAKGLGLLTAGWARMHKVTGKDEYLHEAQKLAQWLMNNPSPGYANLCWGYPFDWQSVIFIPKHTPSAVVSTAVGDGLWELFSITRDEKYLEACAFICRFITNDLNRDDMGKDGLCFSYTPIDDYHVHNANLFCGEFLARIGKELDNQEWLDLASRTADYAMAEQNPDGSIFYWGRVQNHNNPNHVDHYHTGFEIRCLFKLHQHLDSEKIRNCYERYLDFYQRNFVDPSGLPKQTPKRPLPVNIHGAAECILLNSMLSPEYKECFETAEQALKWTIKHMQTKEGWFAHLWSPQERIDAPYLRWGQAWMLRAWVDFLVAGKIKNGEWGYWSRWGSIPGRKSTLPAVQKEKKMLDSKINKQQPHKINQITSQIVDKNIFMDVDVERVFFIIGVGRSGTTLLQAIINAHPDICMPPESHFIRDIIANSKVLKTYQNKGLAGVKTFLKSNTHLARLDIDVCKALEPFSNHSINFSWDFLFKRYLALYAHQQGKKRVGEKDPSNIKHIEVMKKHFPHAILIHIIRDPRDVVLSRINTQMGHTRDVSSWARNYVSSFFMGREYGRGCYGTNYIEVYYEDLIQKPADTIKQLCGNLDVPYDPIMLNYQTQAAGIVAQDEMAWKKNVFEPIMTTNSSKWLNNMDTEQIRLIESLCSKIFEVTPYNLSASM